MPTGSKQMLDPQVEERFNRILLGKHIEIQGEIIGQLERTSEKERCKKCNTQLHEYEKFTQICDNCDYKSSLCNVPISPTKGREANRND